MMLTLKPKFLILSIPVLIPSFYIWDFWNASTSSVDWSPQPFDRKLWQAPREMGFHPYGFPFLFSGETRWHYFPVEGVNRWDPTRYRMLDNLTATHKLVGMTTSDVRELLGPPSSVCTTKDGIVESLSYSITRPGGTGQLTINFHKNVAAKWRYSPGYDDSESD